MSKIYLTLLSVMVLFSACYSGNNKDEKKYTLSADAKYASRRTLLSTYPDFSWDSLPVALHFSSYLDYTDENLRFMSRFPLITIEKNQGFSKYRDVRKGTKVAIEGIKKYNPDTKILFYWNSRLDNCQNYFGKGNFLLLNERYSAWTLCDDNGKPIALRGLKSYDLSVKECREWWVDFADSSVIYTNADGCYIDALQKYFSDGKKINEERTERVREGVLSMLSSLDERMGEQKLVIFNNIYPGKKGINKELYKHSNGFMIEHFCSPPHREYSSEEIEVQISAIQQAGKDGRIAIAKAWPRHYFRRNENYPKLPDGKIDIEQMKEDARKDIIFPLACYLVAAGEYSYFCYSWGWNSKDGGLLDYDEYHKPLGKPLGDAVKNKYVYTRKFEHAEVYLDIEKHIADIKWLK